MLRKHRNFPVILLLLVSCAAKRPVETLLPITEILPDYPKGEATDPPPETTQPPPRPTPGTVRVALVLGGAGVASFATVGLLKEFRKRGIEVELIVSSGWPSIFALGYGLLKSHHDLEWFAMLLGQKDFERMAAFDASKKDASDEKLTRVLEDVFKQKHIEEARIPIVVSVTDPISGNTEIYDRGEWKTPLLRTLAIPALLPTSPIATENGWEGVDVNEALRRQARFVVAVEMYEDYFEFLKIQSSVPPKWQRQIREAHGKQLELAQLGARIHLRRPPTDFSAKRIAILAGAQEGRRLAKKIRAVLVEK